MQNARRRRGACGPQQFLKTNSESGHPNWVAFFMRGEVCKKKRSSLLSESALKELGRTPSLGELTERVHVSTRTIRKLFGNYGMAVRACGMEPPRGAPTPLGDLFEDWAGVVRKTGKLPTIFEYERESAYSSKPLVSRFKGWRQVPQAMVAYAERHERLPGEWADVLEIAKATGEGTWLANSTSMSAGGPPGTGKILTDRPVYGPPMMDAGMFFWSHQRDGSGVPVRHGVLGSGFCGDANPGAVSRLRGDAKD